MVESNTLRAATPAPRLQNQNTVTQDAARRNSVPQLDLTNLQQSEQQNGGVDWAQWNRTQKLIHDLRTAKRDRNALC